MCRRPRAGALALAIVLGATLARAVEPALPRPDGFVTDRAGVLGADVRQRITRLAETLQARTGAELAVLTVRTTQPLDDFTYAMRVAEAWGVGKRGEDTGVLLLVATDDRRSRIVVGYGLEGILPDGLVGAIQDEEMVPAFRAGRIDEGIWRGAAAIAGRIAEARGVTLDGVPPPSRPRPAPVPLPGWAILLLILLVCVALAVGGRLPRGGRRLGGFPGGFGGGGGGFGGFGGFGGGRFGGGGAGRSW